MVADLAQNVTTFITMVLPALYKVKKKPALREMLQFKPVCDDSHLANSTYQCSIQFSYKGQLLPEEGITLGKIMDFNSNITDETSRLSIDVINWLEDKCSCEISLYVNRILPTIFCFLVFFGLIANFVVFYLTVHLRKRHVVDIYVLNLCVADGLLLVSTIPNDIMERYGHFPFPDLGCKLTSYATFIFMSCTRYSVVILALDRYIAVGWPISGRKFRTRKFANVLCSTVWVFAIVSSSYCLVYRTILEDTGECVWDISEVIRDKISLKIFFFTRISIIFFVPQTILILLYIAIVVTLLRNQHRLSKHKKSQLNTGLIVPNRQINILSLKSRTTKVILAVLSSSLACGMPNVFSNLLQAQQMANINGKITEVLYRISLTTNMLLYLGSVLNPIIYTFLRREMRSLLIRRFNKFVRRISNLEIVNRFGDFYENTMATTEGESDWQDENENRSRFSSMMISSVGEGLQNRRRIERRETLDISSPNWNNGSAPITPLKTFSKSGRKRGACSQHFPDVVATTLQQF